MMGLGDVDLLNDGGGGIMAKGTPVAVSCSICLEAVTDNGERSWAKLQCGHQFHLDCIGSAFNSKGAMQCPNCRKIEKGQWLFANGSRSQTDLIMEEWPWPPEEDLYDISFSEMSFGVHWCPFSGLTRLPSSPDGGEFSSSSHNDPLWRRPSFPEHTPGSSTNAPCPPFIAYLGPIRASSSTSSGNISDGPNLRNHWSGPSNQPSVASVTQRTARSNVDMPRPGSFMHPVHVSHSSASRAPSSVTLPAIPPYSPYSSSFTRGSRDRARGYYQQPINNNPTARASVGPHRGSAQVPPVTSTSDQSNGFYFFSSGRNFPEAEQPVQSRYNPWEREHPHPFQVDRESIWGPFYPTASGRQNHGSERVLSQHR